MVTNDDTYLKQIDREMNKISKEQQLHLVKRATLENQLIKINDKLTMLFHKYHELRQKGEVYQETGKKSRIQ
jgi:hypothetical protein